MANKSLTELKNIGKTVASKLQKIGITNENKLRKAFSPKAYKLLSKNNGGKHLPVCYYLYSLEAELQNKHWDSFSEKEKTRMRLDAGLLK